MEPRPREGPMGPELLGRRAPLERLLTLREVAEFLQLDERTIRRWIASKGFPCVHLGTRLRFSQRDVLRWVSAREEGR